MSWSAIASAVGGAAKEAMSNAPEASGLHGQSAASEEHAAQRELDAKMKDEQAGHELAQQRYAEENERFMSEYYKRGADSRNQLKSYYDSVNIGVGGVNNFVLKGGSAQFMSTPTSVTQVEGMGNKQNDMMRMMGQAGL
jgi:hypothetical protein